MSRYGSMDESKSPLLLQYEDGEEEERRIPATSGRNSSGSSRHFWEVLYSVIVAWNVVSVGCSAAITGILTPALQHDPNPELRADFNTGTTLAAIFLATGTAASIGGGWLADSFGRRPVLLLLGQPLMAASWLSMAMAPSLWWFYVSRVVAGIPDGVVTALVSVYISEISTPAMRGSLSNLVSISLSLGTFIDYTLGWLLHWRAVMWVQFGMSVVSGLLVLLVPETPHFLLVRGKETKARNVLEHLRGPRWDVEEEIDEIKRLRSSPPPPSSSSSSSSSEHQGGGEARRICSNPAFLRRLLAACVFNALSMLTGAPELSMFTVDFLSGGGVRGIDPYAASAVVSGTRLLAALAATYTLARFKRMTLLLASGGAMAALFFVLAAFPFLQQSYSSHGGANSTIHAAANATAAVAAATEGFTAADIVVPSCVLGILVAYALGFHVAVITAEVFPTEVRSTGCTLSFTAAGVALSLATYALPACLSGMGLGGTCLMFGALTLATAGWGRATLPETKDRSLATIEEDLLGGDRSDGARSRSQQVFAG